MRRAAIHLLFVAFLLLCTRAHAQPSTSEATTRKARELYAEGAAAQEKGQLEKARALLTKALKLKRHYQIAASLGSVEINLGRYRTAAEHLSFALADVKKHKRAPADHIKKMGELLLEAQGKVVTLELKVTLLGGERATYELLVDNKPHVVHDGVAFMDPGNRQVHAQIRGAGSVAKTATGKAGDRVTLQFDLRPVGSRPILNLARRNAATQLPRPVWPLFVAGGTVLVGLAGLVVGIGVGTTKGDKADELGASIESDTGKRVEVACAVSDEPLYSRCLDWRSERAGATDFRAIGIAGTAVLGAGILFGTLYETLSPGLTITGSEVDTARIVPVVTKDGAMVLVGGRF